jgi:hypothetical protein
MLRGYSVQNLSSLKSTIRYDGTQGLYYAKFKSSFLLEHHSGSSTEIRHGARGLLGVHTFFMIVVFSTKAEIPLDN